MIDEATIVFDGPVVLGSGAFVLSRLSNALSPTAYAGYVNPTGTVGYHVVSSIIDGTTGKTTVIIQFDNSGTVPVEATAASLLDGKYQLKIDGDAIDAVFAGSGSKADADGDGTAGGQKFDNFTRLFGDSDGDGDVDGVDYGRFRQVVLGNPTYADYLAAFDWNGSDMAYANRLHGVRDATADGWFKRQG